MLKLIFGSNRGKCSINTEFREIFKDEFSLMRAKYNSKILHYISLVVFLYEDYHALTIIVPLVIVVYFI